jgi:hypothetical protein
MAKTNETNKPASRSRCTPFNLLWVGDSVDNIINRVNSYFISAPLQEALAQVCLYTVK